LYRPKEIKKPLVKNAQEKPSNSKGIPVKIPEIGKKVEPLIEEAKKYRNVEEFKAL